MQIGYWIWWDYLLWVTKIECYAKRSSFDPVISRLIVNKGEVKCVWRDTVDRKSIRILF